MNWLKKKVASSKAAVDYLQDQVTRQANSAKVSETKHTELMNEYIQLKEENQHLKNKTNVYETEFQKIKYNFDQIMLIFPDFHSTSEDKEKLADSVKELITFFTSSTKVYISINEFSIGNDVLLAPTPNNNEYSVVSTGSIPYYLDPDTDQGMWKEAIAKKSIFIAQIIHISDPMVAKGNNEHHLSSGSTYYHVTCANVTNQKC